MSAAHAYELPQTAPPVARPRHLRSVSERPAQPVRSARPDVDVVSGPRPRDVVLPLLALAAAVVALVVLMAPGVTAEPDRVRVAATVVVAPGDTLWDIAVAHAAPGVDPRQLVEEIQRVNGLGRGPVAAYTPIVVPVLP